MIKHNLKSQKNKYLNGYFIKKKKTINYTYNALDYL